MEAAVNHAERDEDWGDCVARALAESTVIEQQQSQADADRFEAAHRHGLTAAADRLTATRRDLKLALGALDAEQRAAKARHAAEMADLAERRASLKEKASADIAIDENLMAAHRAFLDRLGGQG
jgi:hypothetical protein